MITLVSYGLGNIRAFKQAYKRLGIPTTVAEKEDDLDDAERLVLPGVGAFDWAMERLERSGMRYRLDELVLSERVPVLGVCVGMQMMGDSSEEGERQGLGWIPAHVKEIEVDDQQSEPILPHMGWNTIEPCGEGELFEGIPAPRSFYFLHSFHMRVAHLDDQLAETSYGQKLTSAIHRDNIWGVQFHPEKSHHFGLRLLENFAEV